jgi:hypothetical protein
LGTEEYQSAKGIKGSGENKGAGEDCMEHIGSREYSCLRENWDCMEHIGSREY